MAVVNEIDVVNLGLNDDDEDNMGIEQPENVPHLDEGIHHGQHVGHDLAWLEEAIEHPDLEDMPPTDYNNVMAAVVAEFYNPPLDYEGCRYNYQPYLLEQ